MKVLRADEGIRTCGECDLLRRCRQELAIGAPEWEFDVGRAMELDADLVADIDAVLA
ncbi:MAG: hypothetical protein U1E51_04625 [Candidatus Binatia bacterium]|nr:hypothetical protein [Candidatus Binatia bacterium]